MRLINSLPLALMAAVVGLGLRVLTGGWFLLLLAVLYLAVCIAHTLILGWRLPIEPRQRRLAIISSLLLLLAFLLQLDAGDGPCLWTTITGLIYGMGYAPCVPVNGSIAFGFDILIFAPVVWSWILVIKQRRRDKRAAIVDRT
jgi:hypothetical protein